MCDAPRGHQGVKILAILQNQWVRDPNKVRATMACAKDPEAFRRRFTRFALFAGCKTGRMLHRVFGPDLCKAIIWEEASREIAAESSGVFPADLEHVRNVITIEQPDIVIGFGRVACEALQRLKIDHIPAPHPAARGADTVTKLRQAYQELCRRAETPGVR